MREVWEVSKTKPKGKTPSSRVIMPGERALSD